jgi:pimeloyl-ACP methyl ester carboxylesterase
MEGDGPPLMLITGFGGDVSFWKRASDMLSDRFTIIRVDNRGIGNTLFNRQFTLEDIAKDIICLVDELGFDKVSVVGWSMGSHIAQRVALLAPDRITALILISSYRYVPARTRYIMGAMLKAAENGAPMEYLAKTLNCMCYTEEFFRRKEKEGRAIRMSDLKDSFGLRCQLNAMELSDVTEIAKRIEIPTLLIHGDKDIMVECEEGMALADLIWGCRTVIIEGVGHLIPADKYAHYVANFIESNLA